MTEIPDDVMKLAEDAYLRAIYMTAKDEPKDMVNMVARAILAEREAQRERDAKIAEAHFDLRHADKARFASASIAAAIRKG